ncbi:predicted protein [Naegleria gruberi]|uniref:Predicted protein n=1 Tax=Naegleria gruberi TaxID=5762 RepID=D2VSX6_NAEGR|nr:uncharacterized protein NAEGRDRAFT_72096 [Naegleria gruberi]EFC39981.1 predicted protein [Naegleria gruberi]|eukprot:XP_002672725.1 predicted protein [Naegleria gruberi strain NEG-M]
MAAIMGDHVYIPDKKLGVVVLNLSNGARNEVMEQLVPQIEDGIGIVFASETEMILSRSGSLELWTRPSYDISEKWSLQVKREAAKERGYLFLFNMAYERSSELLYVLDCDIMRVSVIGKNTLDIIKTFGEDLNLTSICIDEEKGHLYCCYNNIVIYN